MTDADLKLFSLLAEFHGEDREALAEHLEDQQVDHDVRIFTEGEETDGLVLVVEGAVRVGSHKHGYVGTIGPGGALGALSVVAVGPRVVTAIASSRCRLLLLRRTAFRRLMEDAPRTASRLLEAILRDLSGALREGLGRLAPGGG